MNDPERPSSFSSSDSFATATFAHAAGMGHCQHGEHSATSPSLSSCSRSSHVTAHTCSSSSTSSSSTSSSSVNNSLSAPDQAQHVVAIVGSGLAALSTAIAFLRNHRSNNQHHDDNEKPDTASSAGRKKKTARRRGWEERRAATTIIDPEHHAPQHPTHRSLHRPQQQHSRPPIPPRTIIHLTLYERDESFDSRKDGYGLTLKYDPGTDGNILGSSRLDVLEELCCADCPSRSHYILNSEGLILGYYGNAFSAGIGGRGGYGQRGNLRVPRQQVRQILLNKLNSLAQEQKDCFNVRIVWGHRLVDLHPLESQPSSSSSIPSSTSSTTPLPRMRCRFANGVEVDADWVIGADGIRSTVVQRLWPDVPPPRPLGVRLIVGLSLLEKCKEEESHLLVHQHASLLDERGFYTHGPGHRLFVMPYSAPSPLHPNAPRQYMWQLSFAEEVAVEEDEPALSPGRVDDDAGDNNASVARTPNDSSNGSKWLEVAIDKCQGWHDPVLALLQATPAHTVWSSHLCDRDPKDLCNQLSRSSKTLFPVFVVGDALHAMSCFKGQGAHQALRDGWTAAHWWHHYVTGQCSASAAVRCCARDLAQRTGPVVIDSRIAARDLHRHSGEWEGDSNQAPSHTASFAGLSDPQHVQVALHALRSRNVRAGSVEHLDGSVAHVLRELNFLPEAAPPTGDQGAVPPEVPDLPESWKRSTLQAAQDLDLPLLRRLSWTAQHGQWMQHLADDRGNTCLHLVVQAAEVIVAQEKGQDAVDPKKDCLATIQWLVLEAGCDAQARNLKGHTPGDSVGAQYQKLQQLIQDLDDAATQRWQRHCVGQ